MKLVHKLERGRNGTKEEGIGDPKNNERKRIWGGPGPQINRK